MSFLREFWRFSRPHTIIGTTLSLVCLWVMARGVFRPAVAGAFADVGAGLGLGAVALAFTWVACITANVYIVGLNQLTDIGLDRINKPYLPLASGAWTVRTGQVVVWACFGVSLLVTALLGSRWLHWTVGLSLLLGTAYSLPPLRLKRFNFWAAFCIIAVRSLIVNILLFAHVAAWGAPIGDLPPLVWLLVFVMFAYSVAIAWFKDLPDDAGDKAFGVETLTVRLGKPAVLRSGAAALGGVLLVAALVPWLVARFGGATIFLSIAHLAFLGAFLLSVRRVDLDSPGAIRRFYLGIWALFFAEYLVFAAAGWLL